MDASVLDLRFLVEMLMAPKALFRVFFSLRLHFRHGRLSLLWVNPSVVQSLSLPSLVVLPGFPQASSYLFTHSTFAPIWPLFCLFVSLPPPSPSVSWWLPSLASEDLARSWSTSRPQNSFLRPPFSSHAEFGSNWHSHMQWHSGSPRLWFPIQQGNLYQAAAFARDA